MPVEPPVEPRLPAPTDPPDSPTEPGHAATTPGTATASRAGGAGEDRGAERAEGTEGQGIATQRNGAGGEPTANGQAKRRDPLSIPTVIFPFEDVRFRYVYDDEMDIKSVVDSIRENMIKPGDLVWLSDGETRIQATIEPRDGMPGRIQAKVHWATQEQVPYPLD